MADAARIERIKSAFDTGLDDEGRFNLLSRAAEDAAMELNGRLLTVFVAWQPPDSVGICVRVPSDPDNAVFKLVPKTATGAEFLAAIHTAVEELFAKDTWYNARDLFHTVDNG